MDHSLPKTMICCCCCFSFLRLPDLVKTIKENIKFVQSDQNGPIWHLGAVEIGPELGLHLNICLH